MFGFSYTCIEESLSMGRSYGRLFRRAFSLKLLAFQRNRRISRIVERGNIVSELEHPATTVN